MNNDSQILTKRECGECEVCCYVAEVKEGIVNKPACRTCPFQNNGCAIFDKPERPQVCSSFQCGWLRGAGKEKDRPDKSNVMVSVNQMNGGVWIMVMDLEKDAHKTTGKNIVIDMINKYNLPAIVVDYDNLEKGKGDYVVLKKDLEKRAYAIMGKHTHQLEEDINIYKLIIGN